MPINSMESTMPKTARLISNSWAIPGDAKAIDKTSNPSRALSKMHIITTIICIHAIGELSIKLPGLLFIFRCHSLSKIGNKAIFLRPT